MVEPSMNLSPEAFRTLDPSVQILDVRESWEYELTHLPGAILIPLGKLMARAAELDATRPVVAYCHHGVRSLQALRYLLGAGFQDLRHLSGGIDAYSLLDPTVARY